MKRIPHTADFRIDGAESELYREITRFVKRESAKAADVGDDPRARAVSFLISLYQRRLASSTLPSGVRWRTVRADSTKR